MDHRDSKLTVSSPVFRPDLTPEEKARGLARAIRKQTGEVKERWERLKGHVGGWHNQVEQALERLQELQSSMDQLDLRLTQAEEAKATWQPVGDLLIDSLQDHIDRTLVSPTDAPPRTAALSRRAHDRDCPAFPELPQ